jgi:serine phosphatase RsbU (regulator of sigma subunit)
MIPLGNIYAESIDKIQAFSLIYKAELKSSLEETIYNIIQNFDKYLLESTRKINKITEPIDKKYDYEIIEKNITKEFIDSKFIVTDSLCNVIYKNYPVRTTNKSFSKSFGKKFIEQFGLERVEGKIEKTTDEEKIYLDDIGFSNIFLHPNQIQILYNSAKKTLLFSKILPKEANDGVLLCIFFNNSYFLNKYIKNIDKRSLIAKQQHIDFVCFDPNGFKWIISPNSNYTELLEIAKTAYITEKPIFREIKSKGSNKYVLCIHNNNIKDVCYIGVISKEILDEQLENKKKLIWICTLMSSVILITIIYWIIHHLLIPLNDLKEGIINLEKRKFETQIPLPQGNDEFVQLFKEFNYMMSDSYDLQLAKNVQEGIITTKFPQISGFDIDGFSLPFGDLGGDCLTSFSMPDGKILFLFGDLTGHNIGSALMMAFIHSIAFNWSQTPRENPLSLVESIEQTLCDNHMKNMFIGIICGLLEPDSKKIKFITRGHIFPLFIRKGNSFEWLGQASLPLGIGKRRKTELLETSLLPGDCMLCVTDGIIEINCNGGLTTGYDNIVNWASKERFKSCREQLLNIINEFNSWCIKNNANQTDDISLFAIISKETEVTENL